jgi:uncharacterized protein YcnI
MILPMHTQRHALARLALAAFLLQAVCADAHVTVWPRESHTREWEKYVVRVPTEGKVATASVELQIPEDVYVVSMGAAAGFTYKQKKAGKRVVSITWTRQIEPGEFAEFAFMARNPSDPATLVWKAVQRFVDGSVSEWTGPVGDAHPAPVTRVLAVP